jgi:hypothetical protein
MPIPTGSALKYGIAIGVGIAVGALGVTLLTSKKKSFRAIASDAISKGLNFKEKALTIAEGAKEAVSDILAEAAAKHQSKNEEKSEN